MGLTPNAPGGEIEFFHLSQGSYLPYLIILIPMLGGLLSGWLVYTFAPEAEGHGTDEVIRAYHKKRGVIKPLVPIVKLFASVITIGTGGSGGREGPIAQIGAGFGSFLSMRLGMNTKTRRWLLAAGMGAGIGSIFHAPLAGAIFAAEVLYSDPEIEAEVLLPAAVSSIIAYTIYAMVFGWNHMFIQAGGIGFTSPLELLPYLLMAICLAFLANGYVKVFYGINSLFKKLKINNIFKPAIGGLITGLLGFSIIAYTGDHRYVVDIMGGGYGLLQEIFNNGIRHVGLFILILIGLGKILTTSFSIGSGGSAGVFGPSMVIGGAFGTVFGFFFQQIMPAAIDNPISFTIVGMAGFFAAAANTPLSTIIMVSELTGNYELLLPTMWVCTISYFVARRWSIYRAQVPNMNYSQAHFGKYSPDIINVTKVGDTYKKGRIVIEVKEGDSISKIMNVVEKSRQRVFPVTDEHGYLLGGFNLDDVTHTLHDPESHVKTAKDLMYKNVPIVRFSDNLTTANQVMNSHFMDEAIIVDDTLEQKVVGIIASSDIVLTYNRKLSEITFGDEDKSSTPYDSKLLHSFSLKSVLETDLSTIAPEEYLRSLVDLVTKSKRNIFPVVDEHGNFHGIVLLNDIRSIMFDSSKYNTVQVKDVMQRAPDTVNIHEPMSEVIEKFERTNAWNLPVMTNHGRYAGLVSKSRIFTQYRNELIKHTEV